MDENKRQELLHIGYKIENVCGLCEHFTVTKGSSFGTCNIHTYVHLKHTGPPRQLSVYEYGGCPKFEAVRDVDTYLNHYIEFMK